jgi:hypothetical protein
VPGGEDRADVIRYQETADTLAQGLAFAFDLARGHPFPSVAQTLFDEHGKLVE